MKKTFFTLIEMIVVIVIISILAAIVVPNISNFQKDGITSMVKSNIRILQTASDTYKLKTGEFPSFKQPTLEEPQLIDIDRLYPDYIKSKPDYEKVKNQLYWVDVFGQVWGATVESPYNIFKHGNSIEWRHKDNAVAYNLYLLQQNQVTGAVEKKVVKLSDTYEVKKQVDRIQLTTPNPNFLLSSIDEYGLESAPSGINNQPESDWFTPILRKSGVFEFELTAKELMYWDSFSVLEEKPEGTDIQYTFAIQNDKGEYGEFISDFYSLAPSKGIKVRVNMIAANGKLPILWDMNIHYHYAGMQMDQFDMVKAINIQDNKVINPSGPVYIEEHFSLPQGEYLSDIVITDSYVNPPKVSYSYKLPEQDNFAPILSFRDVPQGSTVRVEKEYTSGGVYVAPTLVERTSKQPVQQSLEEKVIDYQLIDPEWTTVNRMNFFAHAGDGEITHWIDVIADDVQPEGTRILYRYATSSGQSWSGEVDAISKVSDSRSLRISAYLQVKTDKVGKVQQPTINSIRVIHERGVIDLDTVKPTVAIVPIKSNNKNIDNFSDQTRVQWSYEAFDPRGQKIIETEWAGDKRESYPIGNYEVKLRVRNESNYWSDWVTYKIVVKQENPMAVISSSSVMFEEGKPIEWKYDKSVDPDGDGIATAEWSGDTSKNLPTGSYTVKLRVQDKEGNWSDWISKNFNVVPKSIFLYKMEAENPYNVGRATYISALSGASNDKVMAMGTYECGMSQCPGYIDHAFEGNGFDIVLYGGSAGSIQLNGVSPAGMIVSDGENGSKVYSLRNINQGRHTLRIFGKVDYMNIYGLNDQPTITNVNAKTLDKYGVELSTNVAIVPRTNIQGKIYFTLNQEAYVTAYVKDNQNKVIRTLQYEQKMFIDKVVNVHVLWDGKDNAGNLVPSGNYTVELISKNMDKNKEARQSISIAVDNEIPVFRVEAEHGTVTKNGGSNVSMAGASNGQVTKINRVTCGFTYCTGGLSYTFVGNGIDIYYMNQVDSNVYIDGKIVKTISETVPAGQQKVLSIRNLTEGQHTVAINMVSPNYTPTHIDYFEVFSDDKQPTLSNLEVKSIDSANFENAAFVSIIPSYDVKGKIYYNLNKNAYVTATVKNANGQVVKTILSQDLVEVGAKPKEYFLWDGTNYQGNVVPAGAYTVDIKAESVDRKLSDSKSISIHVGSQTEKTRFEAETSVATNYGSGTQNYASASAGKVSNISVATCGMTKCTASATYKITGTGVDIVFMEVINAHIYVDGVKVKTMNQGLGANNTYTIPVRNLSEGQHTIQVTNTTTYNINTKVDYFDVYQ